MHDSFSEFPHAHGLPNKIIFSKYHGLGNDFILVDYEKNQSNINWEEFLRNRAAFLCDRHLGIGADGILVLKSPVRNVFDMTVINRDQSLARNCGNGLRCAAQHFFSRFSDKKVVSVAIAGRNFFCTRADDNRVLVHMGKCEVVFKGRLKLKDGTTARLFEVDVGNHHLVVCLDRPCPDPKILIDEVMRSVKDASDRNIGITTVNDDIIENHVFERGVGFTNSCASGAVASACVHAYQTAVLKKVMVHQPGGTITVLLEKILLTKEKGIFSVSQEGEACFVFAGECAIQA